MSVIRLPLQFVGSFGEQHLYTLFESGRFAAATNLSCISPDYVRDIEKPVSLGRVRRVATASEGHYIEIHERVVLDFYIEDILLSDEFLVVPGLSEEAIIGAATMQKPERRTGCIKLNFEHDTVEVDPKVAKMQLI
jgi:hypothetical protein